MLFNRVNGKCQHNQLSLPKYASDAQSQRPSPPRCLPGKSNRPHPKDVPKRDKYPIITLGVIFLCVWLARWRPSLAGLIAVMPLTGLLALLWVYSDSGGDMVRLTRYTAGAVWGIVPAIVFFVAAYVCFRNNLSLPAALGISGALWLAGAMVHQYFLGGG